MQGIWRRVVYVTAYEALAIALSSLLLAVFFDASLPHASVLSAAASAIAIVWNLVYNWGFEAWEARQATGGRGFARRAAHAIGFEAGLILALVPLMAWWFDVGLVEAFLLDLGLIVFFLVYTFVFNLGFDRIFGLPASAIRDDARPA